MAANQNILNESFIDEKSRQEFMKELLNTLQEHSIPLTEKTARTVTDAICDYLSKENPVILKIDHENLMYTTYINMIFFDTQDYYYYKHDNAETHKFSRRGGHLYEKMRYLKRKLDSTPTPDALLPKKMRFDDISNTTEGSK